MGTQDLGVGTRTVLAIVAAETLGLPLEAIKVHIGDNRYPVRRLGWFDDRRRHQLLDAPRVGGRAQRAV